MDTRGDGHGPTGLSEEQVPRLDRRADAPARNAHADGDAHRFAVSRPVGMGHAFSFSYVHSHGHALPDARSHALPDAHAAAHRAAAGTPALRFVRPRDALQRFFAAQPACVGLYRLRHRRQAARRRLCGDTRRQGRLGARGNGSGEGRLCADALSAPAGGHRRAAHDDRDARADRHRNAHGHAGRAFAGRFLRPREPVLGLLAPQPAFLAFDVFRHRRHARPRQDRSRARRQRQLGARRNRLRADRLCAVPLSRPHRRGGSDPRADRYGRAHGHARAGCGRSAGRRLRPRAPVLGLLAAQPARVRLHIVRHRRQTRPWRNCSRARRQRQLGARRDCLRTDRLRAIPLP